MIIDKKYDPARGTYFAVCADIRETGRTEPSVIVDFNDLPTAGLVIKYLRGDRMSNIDMAKAQAAISGEGA